MLFRKILLGLVGSAGVALSVGATGLACPGTTTVTPKVTPTAVAIAAATSTPSPVMLLTNTVSLPCLGAVYAGGRAATNAKSFSPAAGKPVTVKAAANITDARISIDLRGDLTVTTTGSGTYRTSGKQNTSTTTLTFTPTTNGELFVLLGNFNVNFDGASGPVAIVTVTVTQ